MKRAIFVATLVFWLLVINSTEVNDVSLLYGKVSLDNLNIKHINFAKSC